MTAHTSTPYVDCRSVARDRRARETRVRREVRNARYEAFNNSIWNRRLSAVAIWTPELIVATASVALASTFESGWCLLPGLLAAARIAAGEIVRQIGNRRARAEIAARAAELAVIDEDEADDTADVVELDQVDDTATQEAA